MKRFRSTVRKPRTLTHSLRRRLEMLEDRTVPAALSINDVTATEAADAARFIDVPISGLSSPVQSPKSITKGPDGDFYVTSASTHAVLRYDGTTFAYLGPFVSPGSGGLSLPVDLVFAGGRLFVSDGSNNEVLQYDAVTGSPLGAFVPPSAHGIVRPTDLLVHGGDLYIGAWSGDVHRYDLATGAFIDKFVQTGSGGLVNPVGIQFGPDGNFYVAEYAPVANNAVLRYDGTTGAYIGEFIPAHTGGLSRPTGMKFGPDGNLYVVDQDNNNVLRYRGDTGAFIDTFVSGSPLGFDQATRLLFAGNQMLVTSQNNNKVVRFDDPPWAVFAVQLDAPSATPVTVSYATADGTALAGSDYVATSGTLTFAPGETTKTVLVRAIDDTIPEPTETFVVNLSNPVGATIADGQGVGSILDNEPVQVASAVVNDGSAQRSEVRSIAVTFTGQVSLPVNPAAAFQLLHLTDGNAVGLAAAVATDSLGRTVVTLTFSGAETDPVSGLDGGQASLADGRYSLTVFSGSVTGSDGLALDGDANGTAGGDYVSPADTYHGSGLHLYRLFGDVNGDGVVDATDLGLLRSAFNSNNSSPLYLSYLDADNSGAIDASDLGQFRARFNQNVFV